MAEQGESLSERELAVLECLADGSTNREIAQRLKISPNTVKVHLRNIFAKLGVGSRTEATTVAIQQNLISVHGVRTGLSEEDGEGDTITDPAPENQIKSQVQDGITGGERKSVRARSFTGALLLLIGLVVIVAIGYWLIAGNGLKTGEPSTSTVEPFTEEPIADSNWVIGRPMPRERANMALAAVGLNLYQIGGEVEVGVVNLVEVFETDSHTWRSAAPKPTAVADATAAVLFGEIYVAGGRLADGRPTSVVEAYSPANNAWRPVEPLPQPISDGLAMSDGSRLYLFGGWDGESYVADAYVYNPGIGIWEALSPMSTGRARATGGLVNGNLFVVGGFDGQQELNSCERFDPIEGEWHICPDTLLPRSGAGAAVLGNNLLYLIGGDNGQDVPFGEVYDDNAATWKQVEMPMLEGQPPWRDLGVTSVETRIYAVGGRQGDTILSVNYRYSPIIQRTFLPAVSSKN